MESTMSEGKIFKYEGEQADVLWDGRLCIHIQECGRAKGELFVGGRTPWCEPDKVDVDNVAAVVKRCPTGAITFNVKDGSFEESAEARNVAVVTNNGPLHVRGDLEIQGAAEDMPGTKFRASLCRCGHSKNKPFCDNSHDDAGFIDHGAVGDTGDALDAAGGGLQIRGAPNGPLLVSGNLSIVSSSGRLAWQGTRAALCRCGLSANKPFCDGAHKEGGFEAD
jgi:CDGSH-type Zn-finger protein/uncharacterized Fe-S cluster protein YjdI